MRSKKLTSAVLAAAALLALGSAGAASARVPHPNRSAGTTPGANCRISLNLAPRLVTSGETVLAYGELACPPTGPDAGQTVTLYERTAGSPGFTVAGTATSDGQGAYQITTAPQTTNGVLYAASGASQSGRRQLKVAALVTLAGPPEDKSLFAGLQTGRQHAVTFTGTVSPDNAGQIIVLQRQNAIKGNEWHPIERTIVNSSGGFALTHAFVVPGASELRVLLRPSARNIASPSNILTYQISQAENPALTILSETNPIPYDGSTVITGTVPGEPNATLTLSGHAAHNPFVTIATTKTNSEGKYSFPAQTPLTSMFYKVDGAGRSSAVLYEGVKYLLTATPSATTVNSGETVTFTGAVTPARAGHTIYLERQDINGPGFHVVQVGTEAADGSYSIGRLLLDPGTEVLRIKVPGDPENGATASSPFTITVNPLPSAAKLPAEPQSNTTLPPAGQS